MKFFKNFLIAAGVSALFFSCSKTDTNIGNSIGTLKSSDTTGDCLPVTVNGTFTAGVPLDKVNNYIDVTVNVTAIGGFSISTDSVNGMSFASSNLERFGYTGLNRVRLYSHGKPIAPGLTTFTVTYDGSQCTVSIIVGSLPKGSFLLSDTTGLLLPIVSGIYTAGVPLGFSDSVVIQINVTKAGSIYIPSNSVDGITFGGTGVFTTTGPQTITLAGTGIPLAAGNFNFYALDSLSDSSKFSITVLPYGGASAASFKMGGAFGCTGFLTYGIYTAGVKIQIGDSVTTSVNVTKAGSYSIVTATNNGVVFSTTGVFDTTGVQTVTLKGTGLPTSPGSYNYSAVGDSSACSFSINYAQGNGVYILGSGAGAACTGFSLNGTYKSGYALTANNTATMQVDVVTVGAYTISTPTVNGMTFTATGNFTATGTQTVILTGTGTPTSPGTYNFPITNSSGNCTFSVNVNPGTAEFTFNVLTYGQCSGFKLYGRYVADSALNSADTAIGTVNVIYPGPYSIVTADTSDGMVFTATGIFTATGVQTVKLYGSGKPAAPGSYNLFITGGTNVANYNEGNCTLSINVASANTGNAAVFALGSSSGNCSGFTLGSGTYTAGTVLTSANTVTVQVAVSTIGTYSISSNTLNGISFKGSGTFTTTGTQLVTLTGSGTPSTSGSSNYTVTAGTNTCIFSITVAAASAITPVFNATISNVATTFTTYTSASLVTPTSSAPYYTLSLGGSDASGDSLSLMINNPSANITSNTTYTQASPNSVVTGYYFNNSSSDAFNGGTPYNTPLSITITKITATEVKGTFSGTFKDSNGVTVSITLGTFDLPL